MEGLRCIDDFTLKCLDREHRAYFNTLYAGTTQVIIDLCQEGDYQTGRWRVRVTKVTWLGIWLPFVVSLVIRLWCLWFTVSRLEERSYVDKGSDPLVLQFALPLLTDDLAERWSQTMGLQLNKTYPSLSSGVPTGSTPLLSRELRNKN